MPIMSLLSLSTRPVYIYFFDTLIGANVSDQINALVDLNYFLFISSLNSMVDHLVEGTI
mgnify:CR=1 FL=1